MTLVVCDSDGVWHEIYNKTEVTQMRNGDTENWQVRTLCCKTEEPEFLQAGIQRAVIDDSGIWGHAPTCVRCAAQPCDHGITFDEGVAESFRMDYMEVRRRWPRLDGPCPKGCGYHGIHYASRAHRVYGDWCG